MWLCRATTVVRLGGLENQVHHDISPRVFRPRAIMKYEASKIDHVLLQVGPGTAASRHNTPLSAASIASDGTPWLTRGGGPPHLYGRASPCRSGYPPLDADLLGGESERVLALPLVPPPVNLAKYLYQLIMCGAPSACRRRTSPLSPPQGITEILLLL